MIMEPLDVVKQTGNTIVFEEFNSDSDSDRNLVTLLTRDDEEISLEKFKNLLIGKDSELRVSSFEEFVGKFAPTVYETVVKMKNGNGQFVYTLEKPNDKCTEIQLKDHAFYKMIMNLLNRKATTDKGNLEFPYDDLKKALTPESEMEECKRIRKNLLSNEKEYKKLFDSGKPSSEMDRYANNIIACREKIISKYKNQSPLALLPVAIADVQKKIDMMKTAVSNEESSSTKAISYNYTFDDKGNLLLEEKKSNIKLIEDNISDNTEKSALVTCLENDFDENALPALTQNAFVKDLVINTFTAGGSLDSGDRAKLEEQKTVYLSVYNSSLQSFAKAVSAVVEKFAGMKAFFDHAAFNGSLAKDVSVVIANCKVDAILNDETAKKRFRHYFRELNEDKGENRIWFGIIPALTERADENIETNQKVNPFGPRPQKNQDKKQVKKTGALTNLETAKEMLALLKECKIMTFTNFKASEETGFMELNAKKIEGWKKDFESVDNEYAVFCYPNFTILPKEASAVKTGTVVVENVESEAYIEIPGIYLEASYIAAGMTVGIQNYKLLKARGFKVRQTYPCVRFDIEEGDNSKIITTKLNRETTTEMEKDVKDAITAERFGFAFADNKIVYDGRILNNAYVMNTRTLKKGEPYYKSIYKTLVKNLVDQLLRSSADTITKEKVEKFIKDYVETWKNDNRDDDRKYANRIMHEGESIGLDEETHKLIVTFNKESEIWDDIVIDDSSENTSTEGGK